MAHENTIHLTSLTSRYYYMLLLHVIITCDYNSVFRHLFIEHLNQAM